MCVGGINERSPDSCDLLRHLHVLAFPVRTPLAVASVRCDPHPG